MITIKDRVDQFVIDNKISLDKIVGQTIDKGMFECEKGKEQEFIYCAIKMALRINFSSLHPEYTTVWGMDGVIVNVSTTKQGVALAIFTQISDYIDLPDIGYGKIDEDQRAKIIEDNLFAAGLLSEAIDLDDNYKIVRHRIKGEN